MDRVHAAEHQFRFSRRHLFCSMASLVPFLSSTVTVSYVYVCPPLIVHQATHRAAEATRSAELPFCLHVLNMLWSCSGPTAPNLECLILAHVVELIDQLYQWNQGLRHPVEHDLRIRVMQ